ncbi:hypothetical protein JCM11251_007966 [Rhodosporidiobolus azoricus]
MSLRKRRKVDSEPLPMSSELDPPLVSQTPSSLRSLTPIPSTTEPDTPSKRDKSEALIQPWSSIVNSALLSSIDLLSTTPLADHAPPHVLLSDPADSNFAAAAWETIQEFFLIEVASSSVFLPREVHPDALYAHHQDLIRSPRSCIAVPPSSVPAPTPTMPLKTTIELSPLVEKVKTKAAQSSPKSAKPSSRGKRLWSPEEDALLLGLVADGAPSAQLAKHFDRSEAATSLRLSRLKQQASSSASPTKNMVEGETLAPAP